MKILKIVYLKIYFLKMNYYLFENKFYLINWIILINIRKKKIKNYKIFIIIFYYNKK